MAPVANLKDGKLPDCTFLPVSIFLLLLSARSAMGYAVVSVSVSAAMMASRYSSVAKLFHEVYDAPFAGAQTAEV